MAIFINFSCFSYRNPMHVRSKQPGKHERHDPSQTAKAGRLQGASALRGRQGGGARNGYHLSNQAGFDGPYWVEV